MGDREQGVRLGGVTERSAKKRNTEKGEILGLDCSASGNQGSGCFKYAVQNEFMISGRIEAKKKRTSP